MNNSLTGGEVASLPACVYVGVHNPDATQQAVELPDAGRLSWGDVGMLMGIL